MTPQPPDQPQVEACLTCGLKRGERGNDLCDDAWHTTNVPFDPAPEQGEAASEERLSPAGIPLDKPFVGSPMSDTPLPADQERSEPEERRARGIDPAELIEPALERVLAACESDKQLADLDGLRSFLRTETLAVQRAARLLVLERDEAAERAQANDTRARILLNRLQRLRGDRLDDEAEAREEAASHEESAEERWAIYHVEHTPRWKAALAHQPWVDGIEGPPTDGWAEVVPASALAAERKRAETQLRELADFARSELPEPYRAMLLNRLDLVGITPLPADQERWEEKARAFEEMMRTEVGVLVKVRRVEPASPEKSAEERRDEPFDREHELLWRVRNRLTDDEEIDNLDLLWDAAVGSVLAREINYRRSIKDLLAAEARISSLKAALERIADLESAVKMRKIARSALSSPTEADE